ncbi:L-type lectin-domain containing receptor kinase S.6-like [Bidens hawaiensis]|uniref:L-type lectin-domain containing receptor kinase S.6-like n=1 Tax=Bidens hawaiensis TaxID=980011 RepID=UPI004049753F
MAWFPLSLLTLLILSLSTPSTSSTSLQFPARYSLSGDKDSDSDSVQLTRPNPSSSGIIFHTTPFKLTPTTSFSTNFTFKIGLSLVIIPSGFASKLAKNVSFEQLDETQFVNVEFGASLCTISFSRVSNVSIMTHELKTGVKLTAWVDYIAILKRVDVRVSEFGHPKPVEPLVSYRVDLGEMWKGEEVLLGLVSDNGEKEEIAAVYSWSFGIKEVPKWMHSIPAVIPKEDSKVKGSEGLKNDSESEGCGDLGFILAIGCGAFAGWIVSHVWSYFVDRRKVQGEGEGEGYVCPFGFRYEKIGAVKANDLETGMK